MDEKTLAVNSNTGEITQIENEDYIADLSSGTTSFCSLIAKTDTDRAILFKAMNNPEHRLSDFINKTIRVKDIFCEVVTCHNRETGEATKCPRIVLIDNNGKGYQCVSLGIFSAVKKLFQIFGNPTWDKPIPLTVVQVTKGERKMLTLDIVTK